MSNEQNPYPGKMAGMAVKHMIESVERRMAAGETVSAAPCDQAEKEVRKQTREKNQKSQTNGVQSEVK